MPDWMSWLHMPKFTEEEYRKQKAAYVAEKGYTITVPGLSDIIIIGRPKPMDSAEKLNWKREDWGFFAPGRVEEIQQMKAKKKERMEAMLASPAPDIATNFGSIMTSIDDAQDAVSTLACIGSVARAIAPKIIGKALLGPVGILWTAADILNFLMTAPYACLPRLPTKKGAEAMTGVGPRTTKGKLKRAPRMKRAIPRKADWIQAAQVTNQIFGYGISLGPIVGLAQDIIAGSVRSSMGQEVKVKMPTPGLQSWVTRAMGAAKSGASLWAYLFATDDEDTVEWISASTLSFQCLHDVVQDWHPLDMIDDVGSLLLQAPIPTDILTLEVIEETGVPLAECCGWPQTGEMWSPIEQIADTTQWGASENLKRFVYRNKHSYLGLWGAASAVESSRFALASLESEAEVSVDFTPSSKILTKMLGAGLSLDPAQPLGTLRDFAGYMHQCDGSDYNPTLAEIHSFCTGPAAVKLLQP